MSNTFSLLSLLAELSIGILGFIAVFTVFARRDGKFSESDKHFIQAMVMNCVVVTGLVILTRVLWIILLPDEVWFAGLVAFIITGILIGGYIALGQIRMPADESKKIHFFWHFGGWGLAIGASVCSLAALFGYWSHQVGFVGALSFLFGNALFCFIAIVFRRFF